jgi:hypothetical protein
VLNASGLAADTKAAFGSSFRQSLGWVAEERLRGDFASGATGWGFRQANGASSNAVVFSGERVVVHVAARGHGVGYWGDASDGPVFSKTRMRLTLRDLHRNVDKSVTFDSFSKPVGDPSRYFLWVVGETDPWVQGSRETDTTCGTYVLTVSDESELYRRADWTSPVEAGEGKAFPRPESSLKVVAYDWRDVLAGVATSPVRNAAVLSGAEFRTAAVPNDAADEKSVFDSMTVFPSYEGDAGLSDEQKAVVIRDNAMVLLSSQGPILPADAPKAPVLGMGMSAAAAPDPIPSPSTRPAEERTSAVGPRRTFSLSGRPVATNVLDDLSDMTPGRNQGYLSFADPVRVLSFASGGGSSGELDEGMAWILSGRNARGMELASGGSAQKTIVVGDEAYEITTEGDWVSSSSSSSSASSSSRSTGSSASSKSSQSSRSSQSSSSLSSSSQSSSSSRSSPTSKSSLSSSSSRSSSSSSMIRVRSLRFTFDETGGDGWYDDDMGFKLAPASASATPPTLAAMSQASGKIGRSVYTKSVQLPSYHGGWYASGYVPWEPNATFAISFWLQNRNDTANDSSRGILSFGDVVSSTQNCINLGYGSGTGHKRVEFNSMGGIAASTGEVLLVGPGHWNFVVFNFNGVGTPVTAYVNNSLQVLTGTTIPTGSFAPSSSTMNVGAWKTAITVRDMLDGSVDDLTFHSAPLSASEVAEMWHQACSSSSSS